MPNYQIDPKILVAEGRAQRSGKIEIALAVRWIDVGRAATAVPAVDAELGIADAYIPADPLELLPWRRAVCPSM